MYIQLHTLKLSIYEILVLFAKVYVNSFAKT
jgi:hypothetical protein